MYKPRLTMCLTAMLTGLWLTGCSTNFSSTPEPLLPGTNATPIGGSAYGGQQPITSAHIYMFAADTGGYGNASDSLLQPYTCNPGAHCFPSTQDANGNYYIVTDTNGNFYLNAGEYACSAGQEVYMYSVAGDAGLGANPLAGLMAVLGQCSATQSFPGVTRILMNEVSTVAAAYAFAGYAVDATHVASAATNVAHLAVPETSTLALIGLANAFANAANMDNISVSNVNGALAKTPGGGTVPQAEINTIADSIAACINSSGASAVGCSNLVNNVMSGGYQTGTAATDTATLAIYIAHAAADPNVTSTVIMNSNQNPPFLPIIAGANDLSVALSFPLTGMRTPESVAIDGNGNVWMVGLTGNSTSNSPGIAMEMSPQGALLETISTGGTNPTPLAVSIDTTGRAWIADATNQLVVDTASSSTTVTDPSLSFPDGVAFDTSGNTWVTNGNGISLSEFNSAGSLVTTFATPRLAMPDPIRIDATNTIWVADATNGIIDRMTTSGTLSSSYSAYKDVANFTSLALDGDGTAWVSDSYNSCFIHLSAAGLSYNGDNACYYGNETSTPSGIALDGLGNIVIANQSTSTVEVFSNTVTLLTPNGYTAHALVAPYAVAVDASGNIWVPGRGIGSSPAQLVELVGAAVPTDSQLMPSDIKGSLDTRP